MQEIKLDKLNGNNPHNHQYEKATISREKDVQYFRSTFNFLKLINETFEGCCMNYPALIHLKTTEHHFNNTRYIRCTIGFIKRLDMTEENETENDDILMCSHSTL